MNKISLPIIALVIFTSVTALNGQSKKVEKLKSDYLESALLKLDNGSLPVIKWENKDTLTYHINDEFEFMSKKKWKSFLFEIENLIDIKFIESKKNSESDIKIIFGELKDYFDKYNVNTPKRIDFSSFDNWSNRKYNKKNQLTSTTFCIAPSSTRYAQRGRFNVKKLFLNSLGILGVLKNEYSLFNKYQTEGNTEFKRNDKRIVKIHYTNSVKAGMSINELKTIQNSLNIATLLKEKY